ncbi:hypothetical protein DYB36_001495 [Aphanomyces astaci]|uniref:Uncharacterized protein n=1 Tax=Aphanomyces astaci TaxID=112090 RepID=A0A396ZSL0_APHAT|nr:hypothetical protein DYB36_001495 [Aphanomyces astaci]
MIVNDAYQNPPQVSLVMVVRLNAGNNDCINDGSCMYNPTGPIVTCHGDASSLARTTATHDGCRIAVRSMSDPQAATPPTTKLFDQQSSLTLHHYALDVAIEVPKGTKPQQHVIVHLETSLKREEGFDKTHFPDKIVLHGGACFDVIRDLNGILTPLTNGSIFIERLSKGKEQALFCLDILHSCALQIISRRNLRGEADLADHLSTEITYEFDDVLELASRYNVQLTTLPQLQKLVVQAAKAKKGTPALSAAVLYATVQPSAASRQHSTWFVLKLLLTIVLTAGLMYLLR